MFRPYAEPYTSASLQFESLWVWRKGNPSICRNLWRSENHLSIVYCPKVLAVYTTLLNGTGKWGTMTSPPFVHWRLHTFVCGKRMSMLPEAICHLVILVDKCNSWVQNDGFFESVFESQLDFHFRIGRGSLFQATWEKVKHPAVYADWRILSLLLVSCSPFKDGWRQTYMSQSK
jgi:hypothetical protein